MNGSPSTGRVHEPQADGSRTRLPHPQKPGRLHRHRGGRAAGALSVERRAGPRTAA
jgi:hypothetical protein